MKIHRGISTLLVLFSFVLAVFSPSAASAATPEAKKVVNINTADGTQLALLPRVGPSVAQRIVEHRKANGAFKKVEDLMLVKGIGEKTFALIRPYLATSGETTLKEKVKAARAEKAASR
ncbi:MAG TPA: helix-hairpin-helix domain-containing protein [Thermoanaerobaculia bacterium]|jgi:competence protein ComEA|nr:helix-hairpin-helix domain-containing protein [Thermoanaerobaculia bacterium]